MNNNQRAQQIWSILVFAAKNRQTLTYDMVSKSTGLLRPAIGGALLPIQRLCQARELPKLTALVVQDKTGMPGEGLPLEPGEFPCELQRVYSHDWLVITAPSENDFSA